MRIFPFYINGKSHHELVEPTIYVRGRIRIYNTSEVSNNFPYLVYQSLFFLFLYLQKILRNRKIGYVQKNDGWQVESLFNTFLVTFAHIVTC